MTDQYRKRRSGGNRSSDEAASVGGASFIAGTKTQQLFQKLAATRS
jgi:hypothetical protein